MNKKYFLLIGLIIPVFLIPVYAQDSFLVDEKKSKVFDMALEKIDKLNRGQIIYIQTELSYCTGYQDYLERINFPILGFDRMQCLDNLEKFIDKI